MNDSIKSKSITNTVNVKDATGDEIKPKKNSRLLEQVGDTIIFEFIRNKKKILTLIMVDILIFSLFFITSQRNESRGQSLPEDPVQYIMPYLSFINFLVMIFSVSIAGGIISRDYQERTGHLLFPKITKERLLTGRLIASIMMSAFCILFFYSMIAIAVNSKYDNFPTELFFKSYGWAVFYNIAVIMFVTFWSSIMKSSTLTIIISLIFLWMVFGLIEGLLSVFSTMEPTFILTYYGRIITNIFDMPEVRYYDESFDAGDGQEFTIRTWLGASIEVTTYGLLIYSLVLGILAFYFFKKRQLKN